MSGTTLQSFSEAQLYFTVKDASSKDSLSKNDTKDSLKEREKLATSKFAARNLSTQSRRTQKMIKSLPDATNSSRKKNTKDWTINKLQFNAIGLLGGNNGIHTLHACWNCMMQPEQQIKEVKKIKEGACMTEKFNQYNPI
eukprot:11294747-Ditylum_brightwellii.AAC.1